ncbi:hypothetical protein BGZ72_004271 [Mortierella alpina]|nr:hypothetical protein BGZ72_004271 [Mortierella alpina]
MDSPGGSELFESYEQDFQTVKASIIGRITTAGEPRKVTLRAADRETDEASEIVREQHCTDDGKMERSIGGREITHHHALGSTLKEGMCVRGDSA